MYAIVRRWEKSGLKQKDFCKAEGINFYKFKYWRTQLKNGTRPFQTVDKPKSDKSGFITVAVENNKATFAGVQIQYPNGVLITCPANTDKKQLRELIKLY